MARPTHHEAGGLLAAQCFFAKDQPKNDESILYSAQLSLRTPHFLPPQSFEIMNDGA